VDSEARRQITETPPPVGEQSPARSPDGKEFVFERVGWAEQFIPNAGVFVVSVLGGPERKISDSGRNPKWALDGRSVLIRDGSPVSIFQVDLQTLQRRPVTQAPSGSREWKFDISPDGSTLAFIRYERSGVGDVYVVSMAGGDPIRLTNWGSLINALAWTSDSRDIVYDVAGQSLWRIAAQTRSPAKGSALAGLESLRTPAANSHQAA
jgi:Tol biopolymer transport system component